MSSNTTRFVLTPTVGVRNRFAPLSGMGNESTPLQNNGQQRRSAEFRMNENTVSPTTRSFATLSLDDKLSIMFSKLEKLETNNQLLINMSSQLNHTATEVNSHSLYLKQLAYHSIDLEARSRRNNLIFYGMADVRGENTVDIMRQFLSDYFELDLYAMGFNRVHRLGSIAKARRVTQYPRRPIIVAFLDYKDTETIMSMAKMLAGTRFGIDRDYPKEISEARKTLWTFKKQQGYSARDTVQIRYPAKLFVNGSVVRDEFPDWYSVLNASRLDLFKHNEPIRTDNRSDSHLYSMTTEIDQSERSNTGEHISAISQTNRSDMSVNVSPQALASTQTLPDHRSANSSSQRTTTEVNVSSLREFPPLSGTATLPNEESRSSPNGNLNNSHGDNGNAQSAEQFDNRPR